MKTRFAVLLVACLGSTLPLAAQAPSLDTSGDGMLNGSYYFRHVLYGLDTDGETTGYAGGISEATVVFGTITFNGSGGYTIAAGTVSDSYDDEEEGGIVQVGLSCYIAETICTVAQGAPVTGTYAISASGFGYIVNPITGDDIYGAVSANGVFVGSSTESSEVYNDLFIAAVATPSMTNSSFSGSYSTVAFLPGGGGYAFNQGFFGNPLDSLGASFQLNPNGAGSLGTVNVSGTSGNGGAVTQSTSATYSFSNGAAVVTFPNNQSAPFFQGGTSDPIYLYFSADGNFFFGGSPTTGFDMIVGVKNSGTSNFGAGQAEYYQAGLDETLATLNTDGYADFDSYYGAFNTLSTGDIFIHQRLCDFGAGSAYGWTTWDTFTPPIAANYSDSSFGVQYFVGAGGQIRIGQDVYGDYGMLGLTVGIQAPTFTPSSSVYITPNGIVNSASFAPFTAGVSDGAMVTIYGTNLAPSAMSATSLPLPTSAGLNGVTVRVNGYYAPINYVEPTQILINVPYEALSTCPRSAVVCYANFQVINNGSASNTVTELLNETTPGVFTGDYGLGDGYVQHSDYSLVTPSNPAQPGETVMAYVSGLGDLGTPVADGAAAPANVTTENTIYVDISGYGSAQAGFSGLVPTLSGLYQINFTVPTGAPSGEQLLDISGPDSYATQATIAIGTGGSAQHANAKALPRKRAAKRVTRKPYCPTGKNCKAQQPS